MIGNIIIGVLIIGWCCTPAFSNLPDNFKDFTQLYPNRWKQLIIIFLQGPLVILIFGFCWILELKSSKFLMPVREWLRR